MWPGSGCAEPDTDSDPLFPRGDQQRMSSLSNGSVTPISFTLDGKTVRGSSDETILETAIRTGIEIPHLCYSDRLRADGNCRACVVEIEGERVLAPSCCRTPAEGMNVLTRSERARHSQSLVLELLRGEVGDAAHTRQSELDQWCEKLGVSSSRFGGRRQPASEGSHPAIAVNLESCIQCTRCLRACRE